MINLFVREKGRNPRALLNRAAPWILASVLIFGGVLGEQAWEKARQAKPMGPAIPASEFARMIREFSEPEGYFRSDNLVSNETSYLYIVDKWKELGAGGGAYLGVGPEQNFTYIAKIQPKIAFVVDIRRQAMLQHLMFKAIFHLSDNRTKFLSLLLSRPVQGGAPGPNAAAGDLVDYFSRGAADQEAYARNLTLLIQTITADFGVAVNARDRSMIEDVYGAFRDEGFRLQYRSGGTSFRGYGYGARRGWGGYFPTFADLVLQTDLHGKTGNFLASRQDYEFVRSLQEANRIIPVTGDFAGPKTLKTIGEYLRKNGYSVTAFYTSNVEQYLFSGETFAGFAKNVALLPITEKSLFIRAYPNQRLSHPARIGNHRLTTLLQKITVFLDDYRQGLYPDYWTLVTTNYIAAR